jgi:hypothetical protein
MRKRLESLDHHRAAEYSSSSILPFAKSAINRRDYSNINLPTRECSNPDNHANSIQRPVSSTLVTPERRTSRFGLEAVVCWFDKVFFLGIISRRNASDSPQLPSLVKRFDTFRVS